jgi:hypothetical protein
MAVVVPTIITLDGGTKLVTWLNMLNGDTGAPVYLPEFGDRSVQLFGTLGVGGNARLEGSNQLPTVVPGAAEYWTLTDPGLTAINLIAIGAGETVLDPAVQMRPNITAGDGTTSLTVRMFCRRIY